MIMLISLKSYENMNHLAGLCFDANAVFDNLAYCLDYNYFMEVGDIVHHQIAHVMPVWADMVTDKMLELNARPTRTEIGHYEESYTKLSDMFEVLVKTLMSMRDFVNGMIDSADLDGDAEIRIFGEDFLVMITPFIKQANEWIAAVGRMSDDDLNIHIKEYTHFITK